MRCKATHFFLLLIVSLGARTMCAQHGGRAVFDFLNLSSSARIASLGGNQVGYYENDLSLLFYNPATLNDTMHNQLAINYVPFVSDIQFGSVGYARHFNHIGTFGLGIHHINYGNFTQVDEYNQITGTFSAAEYAVFLTYSKQLTPRLFGGITIKPIVSNLAEYHSFGLAADVGFFYFSQDRLFTSGIVLKNVGSQLSSYDGADEPLPVDLQIGISKKLQHAPFRFSYTLQGLFEWDMDYAMAITENGSAVTEDKKDNVSLFNNFMRHSVLGLEFIPFKNFYVSMGYNHRRRQELKIEEKASTAGYSWGFGFRVYKFRFSYGSARYHIAGSSNHFSITTNLSDF